jgi:hypothetical protein
MSTVAGPQLHTPKTLAAWEDDILKVLVQGQPGQKFPKTLSHGNKNFCGGWDLSFPVMAGV